MEGVYGAAVPLSGQFDVSSGDMLSVYFNLSMALYSVILQESDPHSVQVNHSP